MKLIIFILFFLSHLLFSQEFKIEDVLPKNCGNGKYDCGYKPTPLEVLRSVPLSRSSKVIHRGLPSSVDLSPFMPPVGDQGRQGSCVAWSTTYALKSYQEKIERNYEYDIKWKNSKPYGTMNRVFSPAFVYNQINGGRDQGSYIGDALDLLVKKGSPPLSVMPYSDRDFRTQPNLSQLQEAAKYKALRYAHIDPTNITAIKAELAKGNPVVFGMKLRESFSYLKNDVYDSPSGTVLGGHAMTLVGYDDNKVSQKKHQGAFRFINSWSEYWGDRGYGWVSYRVFAAYTHDAWVLEDRKGTDEPVVNQVTISPPEKVEATKGTYSDKIRVTWSPVKNANAYLVYKGLKTNENDLENSEDQIYVEENSFEDTDIEPNLTYVYRVVSIVIADEDNLYSKLEDSPIAEGFAKLEVEPLPEVVTGLEVKLESNVIKLSWNEVKNANSYEVFKYEPSKQDWKKLISTNTTKAEDKNLLRGEYNAYAVRAINQAGVGEWGEPKQVFVSKINFTQPQKVEGLTASIGKAGGIEVSWKPSLGASSYYLYRYHCFLEKECFNSFKVDTTKFWDDSQEATSGKAVYYIVVAINEFGNSEPSEVVKGVGVSNSYYQRGKVILPPQKITHKLSGNQITLNWEKVAGAEDYYIYLRKPNSKDWEFLTKTELLTTYTYTIPEVNKLYSLAIRSKAEMGGESIFSKVIPAFVNQTKPKVRHRFLPEAGIQNFVGVWEGSFFQENIAPKTIKLVVKNEGNQFTAELFEEGKKPNIYKGTYTVYSNFLKTKDFFLEARVTTGKIAEVLHLQVNNSFLTKKTVELGLMRVE